MKNKSRMCILKSQGGILCKDKRFRSFVNFGTPSWTCKFYNSEGWARRAARRLGLDEWEIIFLYEGDVIDATGHVTRARNVKDRLAIRRTVGKYQ